MWNFPKEFLILIFTEEMKEEWEKVGIIFKKNSSSWSSPSRKWRRKKVGHQVVVESRKHSWTQIPRSLSTAVADPKNPSTPTIMRPLLSIPRSYRPEYLSYFQRFSQISEPVWWRWPVFLRCFAPSWQNKSHREKPLKDAATDSPACWWNWSSLKFGTKLAIMHYRKTNLVQYELYCRVLFVKIRIFPKHPPILAFHSFIHSCDFVYPGTPLYVQI